MELFNQYVLPPSAEHLELLRYLLMLTYLIFLPYIGIVIGSTLLSIFLNLGNKDVGETLYARIARDLMDMAIPSRAAMIVFGVLPLPVIWVVYGQWFIHSTVNTMHLLPVGGALIIAGLFALAAYRQTLRPEGQNSITNIGLGATGLGILVLGAYILFGSVTRFFDPERWFLSHHAVRTLTSWNLIWRFTMFIAASLAITGGAILFFFFRWPGDARKMTEREARFTKNLGAAVSIGGILLFPIVGFFYHITLPIAALSASLYGVGIAMLAVMFIVFVYAYRAIIEPKPRFGVRAFILFLVLFSLMIVGDQITLVNATREHIAGLVTEAEEREAEVKLEREAMRSAAFVADPVRGEQVFNEVCSTCHRWEERLVGPPYSEVLPKYVGRESDLVSFIQRPSKVNPDYPPMPAQGIPLGDMKSVAAYLLSEMESRSSAVE
jgi:cytochrome c